MSLAYTNHNKTNMGTSKYYKPKMFYCQSCGRHLAEDYKKQIEDKILKFKIVCPDCEEKEKV